MGSRAQLYEDQLRAQPLSDRVAKDFKRLSVLKTLYTQRKHIEDIGAVLALFGIVLMLMQNHTIWLVQLETPTHSAGSMYAMLIFISTLVLLGVVIRRYGVECHILRLRHCIPPTSSLWTTPR